MGNKAEQCYRCDEHTESETTVMYGYVICDACKSNLGLLRDSTIQKHIITREEAKAKDADRLSFEEEVQYKLACLEKDYINKKIKLLHIRDRIGQVDN